MKNYASIDILESADGDLMIDGGDFAETSTKAVENMSQYIRTIVNTPQDSLIFPELGVDLGEFVGFLNTEDTAETIKLSVFNAIIADGYITEDSLEIDVFPMAEDELGMRITGYSLPTGSDEIPKVYIFVAYDYLTGRIYSIRG